MTEVVTQLEVSPDGTLLQHQHLPLAEARCRRGHVTRTQKASGSKMRCGRCYQQYGDTVLVTVPSRGPAQETVPLGKRIRRALPAGRHVQGDPVPRSAARPHWVAHGVSEVTCNRCGLTVWLARLSPEAMTRSGYRTPYVHLEPRHADGDGGVMIGPAGLAAFPRDRTGNYDMHRCPARITACKYCGAPVRVLHQPPGSPERLAVVEAEEDPDSTVAVDERGYAVNDPGHLIGGPRYRWHSMHRQADDVRSLMTEIPSGRAGRR